MPVLNCCQFMYLVLSLFGFEGRIWYVIVSVPGRCLRFTLTMSALKLYYFHVNICTLYMNRTLCILLIYFWTRYDYLSRTSCAKLIFVYHFILHNCKLNYLDNYSNITIWAASSEFGSYRLCEQRRFRRACASAHSRQNLRYSLIQAVSQEEPSDRKPDPWPLWMAGHAQLKFVMTECSKTQIRLTRPIC